MKKVNSGLDGSRLQAALVGLCTTDIPVNDADLTLDSRAVCVGDVFVAIAGRLSHGLDHVHEAIERGAAVILWDPKEARKVPAVPAKITVIAVERLAQNLGLIADRFYNRPSLVARVTAITGTNGKTTCAWLLARCYGHEGAYIGTVGKGRPDQLVPNVNTTPDVVNLNRTLRSLVDDGVRHVALEVSSHALDQDRIAGLKIPIAGFTNLSRDHLDYHGSMKAYGDAKKKLFFREGLACAVLNFQDPFVKDLSTQLPSEVALLPVICDSEAIAKDRYIVCTAIQCSEHGLIIEGLTHCGPFELRSRLVGSFNAENLLLVLGLLLAADMPLARALDALSAANAPPGRMETFQSTKNGPMFVVDYAHTPDALSKSLTALRAHVRGELWCVFGCGGDRDSGKRALMAAAAEKMSDHLIITDDNPRFEDPEHIIAMIRAGLTGRIPSRVERDRVAAIEWVAARAGAGDVVLIAGKGHEQYQIYGDERRQFSDRDVVQRIVQRAA